MLMDEEAFASIDQAKEAALRVLHRTRGGQESRFNSGVRCRGVGAPADRAGPEAPPRTQGDRQNESPEEVERVAASVDDLLRSGATWTDKKGRNACPHAGGNPHRGSLQRTGLGAGRKASRRIEGGNRGQVPRAGSTCCLVLYGNIGSRGRSKGIEFLYSLNRLNVAVSRARCVAVIVASPALFQVQCKTPRQIELANAFCRYLEMAQAV
jgi:hypothetical protein